MKRIQILNIAFDPVTRRQALDKAAHCITTGEKCRVVTANAEHDLLCANRPEVKAAITGAQLIFPDGISVILAAKILGRPLPEKIPGFDFGLDLCQWLAENQKSLFLYGAAPGVAEEAAARLREKFPGLMIAGVLDGYRKNDEEDAAFIQTHRPDALFVARGAPAQELFMARFQDMLDCPVMVGLGGSIDGYAGRVTRAPLAWQRLNLEWLYRLIREPRRIKRMIKLPLYLIRAAAVRIKGQ